MGLLGAAPLTHQRELANWATLCCVPRASPGAGGVDPLFTHCVIAGGWAPLRVGCFLSASLRPRVRAAEPTAVGSADTPPHLAYLVPREELLLFLVGVGTLSLRWGSLGLAAPPYFAYPHGGTGSDSGAGEDSLLAARSPCMVWVAATRAGAFLLTQCAVRWLVLPPTGISRRRGGVAFAPEWPPAGGEFEHVGSWGWGCASPPTHPPPGEKGGGEVPRSFSMALCDMLFNLVDETVWRGERSPAGAVIAASGGGADGRTAAHGHARAGGSGGREPLGLSEAQTIARAGRTAWPHCSRSCRTKKII